MFKLFYMSGFDPDLLWVFFLFCFVFLHFFLFACLVLVLLCNNSACLESG